MRMKSFNIQFMETESHEYDETQFDFDVDEPIENIVYDILCLWDTFKRENNLEGHNVILGVEVVDYDG